MPAGRQLKGFPGKTGLNSLLSKKMRLAEGEKVTGFSELILVLDIFTWYLGDPGLFLILGMWRCVWGFTVCQERAPGHLQHLAGGVAGVQDSRKVE